MKCDSDGFCFRKCTKIAQPLGIPRMLRLSWAILHNKWGHSARQAKPFSNKKILTFGSNPFPLEKCCLRACSCHYMLRFFWRHYAYIVTYAGITIVSRLFSLSSYHLARIYSCATASLLSKKFGAQRNSGKTHQPAGHSLKSGSEIRDKKEESKTFF